VLLSERLDAAKAKNDTLEYQKEVLKVGMVRRKEKAGRQIQAAETQMQMLKNEVAEVRAQMERQTLDAQQALHNRTQQWVQEQVSETPPARNDH